MKIIILLFLSFLPFNSSGDQNPEEKKGFPKQTAIVWTEEKKEKNRKGKRADWSL